MRQHRTGGTSGYSQSKKRRIPHSKTITGRKTDSPSSKRKKKKNNTVRGREVTIRDSSTEMQVIYGRMRVGGSVSFINTSQESQAYLITGQEVDQNQLVWTARTLGAAGNAITIALISSGTVGAISISVIGNAISVTLRSSSGTPLSTMSETITAVRAHPAANALVSIQKLNSAHNGVVSTLAATPMAYGGGTWLHQIITLAGHQIDYVEAVYLDKRQVTFGATPDGRWGTGIWANRVFMAMQLGSTTQEAQPDLSGQLPTIWTSNHRQRGCAGVYLLLVWDQNLFPEGYPEIEFLVKGKLCYDPRTLTTVWTQNAALIVADFLVDTKLGLGVSYSDIDETALISAANTCDEAVSLAAGGTEARYTINGVYDLSRSPQETLQELLAAMGGDVVYEGGKWYIYAAVYRTPTLSFNESDIRGEISVNTHVSRSDSFNGVRGTFVSPTDNYNETDLPAVTNATYLSEDGGQNVWLDLALNFVTSKTQGQRLMKIELERVRQGISVTIPFKLRGLLLRTNDNVFLNISRLGWVNKVFEVRQMDIVIESDGVMGVDVVLRENASGIFDWNNGMETNYDLAANTSLPDPTSVAAPSNLVLSSGTSELYVRNDGTVQTRLHLTWTASPSEFVQFGGSYEIQFKRTSDATWGNSYSVPGVQTNHYILDVQDGVSYDVRIRAVNTLAYASSWVTVTGHVVIGKTAPPADVTGFTATVDDNGIQFNWNQIADPDRFQYEIRYGGTGWDSAVFVARILATGTAYLYRYFTPGVTTFRIKAIDTSGNYSTNHTNVDVSISGPNPINGFTVSIAGQSVLLDWTAPDPSSLSVIEYDVYKGDDFATAAQIGTVFGTFHTYIETLGGTFTYWVVAVDVGGNRSTEVSSTGTVGTPENFYNVQSVDPLPDYTSDWHNVIIPGTWTAPSETLNGVLLPVENEVVSLPFLTLEHQNYDIWFASNGWSTFQDAIDQGYPEGMQPGATSPGWMTMVHDFGSLVPAGFLQFSYDEQQLGDPTAITVTLSTSTDGVAYTDYVGASQVFVDSFRYVKIRLDFQGTTLRSLSYLTNFRLLLSLERFEETGQIACLAADATGTFVDFVADFYGVEDIQLTPVGTTAGYAVLNFAGGVNPSGFRILVFDENGTRINYTVGYRIRGAING